MAHITREAFAGPQLLDEVYHLISPITIHVFCAVYIPYATPHTLPHSGTEADGRAALGSELGKFRHYDATESARASVLTE